MISVVMSVYNEPLDYIKKSIKSIQNQTYRDIDFVIINDNPERKELVELLKLIASSDLRIKLITNEVNLGLTASLNKALEITTGDYVARMDADDIAMPNRLETQLKLMEEQGLDLVGCNIQDIDEDDNIICKRGTNYPAEDRMIKEYLKYDSAIPHPTWLAREAVFSSNRYADFPACEDYELLTRLALQGKKFGNVEEPMLRYRRNINGVSSTKKVQQKLSKYYICKNYRKGKYSDLEKFRSFVNSRKGQKKERSLAHYYNSSSSIRRTLKTNRVKGAWLMFSLLCCSNHAKTVAVNRLRKKFLTKRHKTVNNSIQLSAKQELREIKVAERKRLIIEMLQYIDKICRENDIKYTLLGGSLIGAVRHNGIIPWDDDIDIILMPDDYKKLIGVLGSINNQYILLNPDTTKNYYYPFAKLVNSKTLIVEENVKQMNNYGVYIDIFAYHYVSNFRLIRKLQYAIQTKLKKCISIKLTTKPVSKKYRAVVNTMIKMLPANYWKKRYIYHCNKNKPTKYVVSNWPAYGYEKEIQDSACFRKYTNHPFEGINAMMCSDYKKVLSTTFGNYMELPPIEKRKSNHIDTAYWRKDG